MLRRMVRAVVDYVGRALAWLVGVEDRDGVFEPREVERLIELADTFERRRDAVLLLVQRGLNVAYLRAVCRFAPPLPDPRERVRFDLWLERLFEAAGGTAA